MPYCRACGVEVDTNIIYCPECGEELNFKPPKPEEPDLIELKTDPDPESEPENKSKPDSEAKTDSDPGLSDLSIWAKIGAIICVPVALAGIFLEIASVYTLATGGYTLGEFGIVSAVFGLMAFIPLAYLYRIYAQINMSPRGMV